METYRPSEVAEEAPYYRREADKVAEPQTVFSELLEATRSSDIKPIPDLSEQVNHRGKYQNPDVQLDPGLYLAADYTYNLPRVPDAITFFGQPANRLGREDSHNYVFFGKLLCHWFREFDAQAEHQVAVKPYNRQRPYTNLGELAMHQYIQKLGLPTLEPVGLLALPGEEKRSYLLTKFRPSVATMDTIDWWELDEEEKWQRLDVAIDTLVLLHSNLLFHGDFKFRNVGFGERGEVVIVDPELMVSGKEYADEALAELDGDPLQPRPSFDMLRGKMSSDFSALTDSIQELVLTTLPKRERPRNDMARHKEYKRRLYGPYRERLAASDSEYKGLLLRVFDDMVRVKKLRASGEM